jgi:Flp pilus assembly protein TadD
MLLGQGRVDDAMAHFQQALAINPRDSVNHNSMGSALFQKGDFDAAIFQYKQAIQLQPGFAIAHNNLGLALYRQGNLDEAISAYQQALQINPGYTEARVNLGNALLQNGRGAEAASQYRQALQDGPANPPLENHLAWLLATWPEDRVRNGQAALNLARHANEVSGDQNPVVLHTLAAAWAESGHFPEAQKTIQRAIALARDQGRQDWAEQWQAQLKCYNANQPWRDLISQSAQNNTQMSEKNKLEKSQVKKTEN